MTPSGSRKNNAARTLQSLIVFKLFELVVVALVVSALYKVSIEYAMQARGQYERAEVHWTIAAIRSSRQAEVAILRMQASLGHRISQGQALASQNPMRTLSPTPRNYIGELCNPDLRNVTRGSWYFDTCNSWLVYVLNSEKIFATEYPNVMKFNVESLGLLTEPAKTF